MYTGNSPIAEGTRKRLKSKRATIGTSACMFRLTGIDLQTLDNMKKEYNLASRTGALRFALRYWEARFVAMREGIPFQEPTGNFHNGIRIKTKTQAPDGRAAFPVEITEYDKIRALSLEVRDLQNKLKFIVEGSTPVTELIDMLAGTPQAYDLSIEQARILKHRMKVQVAAMEAKAQVGSLQQHIKDEAFGHRERTLGLEKEAAAGIAPTPAFTPEVERLRLEQRRREAEYERSVAAAAPDVAWGAILHRQELNKEASAREIKKAQMTSFCKDGEHEECMGCSCDCHAEARARRAAWDAQQAAKAEVMVKASLCDADGLHFAPAATAEAGWTPIAPPGVARFTGSVTPINAIPDEGLMKIADGIEREPVIGSPLTSADIEAAAAIVPDARDLAAVSAEMALRLMKREPGLTEAEAQFQARTFLSEVMYGYGPATDSIDDQLLSDAEIDFINQEADRDQARKDAEEGRTERFEL